MHRRGHVGMALLAYAPVGFVLLRGRQLGLALLGLIGVLLVEPLPDSDFWLPGLRHRGVSHSLLAALVVGGVIGALGWLIGDRVTVVLADRLTGLDTATVGIFAGLFQWSAEQLRALDGRMLASFGFAVGIFGVFVHLLADAITVAGIRPLLPLSRWRLSLSSLRADSTVTNNVLLGLGVLVLAVVFLVTAPGVGIASGADAPQPCFLGDPPPERHDECVASLDLAPVGVAAGQSQNASGATVEFTNQTTNGSTVVIDRAMLPEGGFVVLHSGAFEAAGVLEGSAIAVSEPLSAGTHRNVTLDIERSPPGGSVNQSALDGSGNYTAILYRDTNNNGRFDYLTSAGSDDAPYIVGSGASERLVTDTARVIVRGTRGDPNATTPSEQASITFEDQRTNGSTVTVQSVTLPQGGWVVVHSSSYTPPQSDPLGSTIGISPYLDAGEHRNVTVELITGTVTRNQTLVARPSKDTNDNQRYDYVRSQGFQDVGYTVSGEVLTDRAQVSISGAAGATTSGPTTTSAVTPRPSSTSPPTTTGARTPASDGEDGTGPLGGVDALWVGLLALVAVGAVAYAYAQDRARR